MSKKNSNYIIGKRTRDITASSAVPRQLLNRVTPVIVSVTNLILVFQIISEIKFVARHSFVFCGNFIHISI
jgi:hypothetical protein